MLITANFLCRHLQLLKRNRKFGGRKSWGHIRNPLHFHVINLSLIVHSFLRLNDIATELTFLSVLPRFWSSFLCSFDIRVNNTSHFLAFLNINFLSKRLLRDDERLRIQPAFILACLALAKLMKSSTMEGGSLGLQQAMMLGRDAHTAFRDAVNLQWIDATLAEAALVTQIFYC